MSMEIERKFLLKELPKELEESGKLLAHMIVDQSYINNTPEVRIRRNKILFADPHPGDREPIYPISGDGYNYLMAVKSSGTLTRTEVEFSIDREVYFDLQAMVGIKPIIKNYYRYWFNDMVHEVSIVDDGLDTGFIYFEIEFASEEEARAYICPFDGAIDVTEDSSYKMKNYWKKTRLASENKDK
ncbi:MAG: hypothetical protein NC548_05900 [Lachnospiraceae bacterium]|nr:hypothetical protein [Lachnospiraceae bacterium]